MAAPARLEKKRGAWGIRTHQGYRANGRPICPLQMIDGGNGRRVTNEAEAKRFLADYLLRLPPPAPRTTATVKQQRLTIGAVALKWHADQPAEMTSKDEYMSRVQALMAETALGVTYPDEITRDVIDAFKARKNNIGVDVPLAYLRSVLAYAADKRWIPALPADVMGDLSRPPSAEADVRILNRSEFDATYAVFVRKGPSYEALAHCLSTYGWRPITACRLLVGDVNLQRQEISLRVKQVRGKKRPHSHILLPPTVAMLRPLVEGRDPSEPLFLHRDPETGIMGGWHYGESADQLCNFYYANCARFALGTGGIYAWKRWAIEGMAMGRRPWLKAMTVQQMMDYTGHKDPAMLLRYHRSNPVAQREAQGLPPVDQAEEQMPVVIEESGGAEVVCAVVYGGASTSQGVARLGDAGYIVAQFTATLGRI